MAACSNYEEKCETTLTDFTNLQGQSNDNKSYVKENSTNTIRRKYVKKEGTSSSSSECESTRDKKRRSCKSPSIARKNYLCRK